jgi:hypothetical protein
MLKLLRNMLAATVCQSNGTIKCEKQHLSTTKKHQITLNKQNVLWEKLLMNVQSISYFNKSEVFFLNTLQNKKFQSYLKS